MSAASAIGYEGFTAGLVTFLGDPPAFADTAENRPLAELEAHTNHLIEVFRSLAALKYAIKAGPSRDEDQRRHRANLEVIQAFIHAIEGSLSDVAEKAAIVTPELATKYEDARLKAAAKLRDYRLALLFMLNEPSDEADAEFGLEYPPIQPKQSSVPLELD